MKNCVECNEPLEDDAKFCSNCGGKQPERQIEPENLPTEESLKPKKAKPEPVFFVLPPDNAIEVDSAAIGWDGKYLALKNRDEVKIIDTSSWEIVRTLREGNGDVTSVSPDGNYVVIAQGTRSAYVINVQTGETDDLGTCTHPGSFAYGDGSIAKRLKNLGSTDFVTFSHDSRYLVTGADKEASLYDLRDGSHLFDFVDENNSRHFPGYCSAAFSHDGRRVVTSAYDTSITFWDARDGEKQDYGNTFHLKSLHKSFIRFSPDDKFIVVGYPNRYPYEGGKIEISNTAGGEYYHKGFEGSGKGIEWVSFTPDGQRLISYDGSHVRIRFCEEQIQQ